MTRRIGTILALAVGLLLATTTSASNYPPDYPTCNYNETKWSGPFEVIKNKWKYSGKGHKLTVAYRGYLRNLYPDDQITIYLRLNGNDAMIPARPGTHNDAYIFLNSGPRDCTMCQTYNAEQLNCTPGNWVCNWPTPTEDHIFFWSVNEWYAENAWDIQLAATAGGQWDSDYGNNFRVRFEPTSNCY